MVDRMESDDLQSTVQKILVSVPEYILKVKCDTNQKTLPFKCAVSSCTNAFLSFEEREKYPYKFHNFPRNDELCRIWKEHCGLPKHMDVSDLKVCSDHFELDDYIRNYKEEFSNPNFKRKLNSNAVPRKNLQATLNVDMNNDGLLNLCEVKQAVDENDLLKKRYKYLQQTKTNLLKKISVYDGKLESKSRELERCKEKLAEELKNNKSDLKGKKDVLHKVFSSAQINLLLGKERVIWSEDDLAKAFTLRHIGNKECYLYLKNTLNMPLPALACVQKWAASVISTT